MDGAEKHQGHGQAQRDHAGGGRHDRSGRGERRQAFDEALDIDPVSCSPSWTATPGAARPSPSGPSPASPSSSRVWAKSWTTLRSSTRTGWPRRILGMGDVLTLIEKAEDAFDEKQAAKLEAEAPQEQRFTLTGLLRPAGAAEEHGLHERYSGHDARRGRRALRTSKLDEKALAHTEAIILSMTPKERENPSIIESQPEEAHRRRLRPSGGGCQHVCSSSLSMMQQADQAVLVPRRGQEAQADAAASAACGSRACDVPF